jgi:hypothetical protein
VAGVCGHHVLVDDSCRWCGVVIAEGLHEPAVINDLRVSSALSGVTGRPVDEDGTEGRWHLYWVDVPDDEIDRIQAGTRHGWYADFWRGDRLLVVYDDARSACAVTTSRRGDLPVDHGLGQGLRREWLEFPTDDSAGHAGRRAGSGAEVFLIIAGGPGMRPGLQWRSRWVWSVPGQIARPCALMCPGTPGSPAGRVPTFRGRPRTAATRLGCL